MENKRSSKKKNGYFSLDYTGHDFTLLTPKTCYFIGVSVVSDIRRPWFQEQYRTLTLDTPLPRISNKAHQRGKRTLLFRPILEVI